MKRVFTPALVSLLLLAFFPANPVFAQSAEDAYKAGRFDNGKMWTFDHPPIEYFKEAYNFEPDDAWFEKARLGALRIPGCSASFVSSHGLVLTNHHCGRSAVTQVTQEGESLTEDGFIANTLSDERRVPDYYADQLIDILNVTDEIDTALESAQTNAERAQARQDAMQAIEDRILEERGGEDAGFVVEIVPLYHGGQYAAYTFKRYDDVRLVMTPELQVGYYGGDADNFTFPRYTLDITFFRIYEDDEPYEPDHYFLWSLEGVQDGDAVFAIGNPGSTSRLETIAQLEVRRDVTDRNLLHFIDSRIDALKTFQSEAKEEDKNAVRNPLFSLLNAQKAYTGQLAALEDPMIMARRRDTETQFRKAIAGSDALQQDYGSVLDEMTAVQDEIRKLKKPHGAFFGLTSGTYSSALMRRAMTAYTLLERKAQGVEEAELASLEEQIEAIPDRAEGLADALLAARLSDIEHYYEANDSMVEAILAGETPDERAADIMALSALASQATTEQALAAGTLSMEDPALALVGHFIQAYRDYQSAFAGLNAQQTDLASRIGRARFEVYGTDIPPDATFSLRIADGVVQGFSYNGTFASPFTSYYGLYDHYYSYGPDSDWALPPRWQSPPSSFSMSVPLNFVSTNDIIGGNSGSPVLNTELELVGLVFDGNIESLAGNYIYLPDTARSVSVDARGILEALDEIYDADRMVLELTDDVLVATEGEADEK